MARPIGRRHASDTFAKNFYSADSTLVQCDAWSHYQPASTADKARATAYQTPLRSSLHKQLKESCKFCYVFLKTAGAVCAVLPRLPRLFTPHQQE